MIQSSTDNSRTFFICALNKKQSSNSRFSLRAAARQIGVSPATLSTFINGKKRITLETGRKISKWLKLSRSESDLFLKLVESDFSSDPDLKREIATLVNEARTKLEPRPKSKKFSLLRNWKNVAIMASLQSKNFRQLSIRELADLLNEDELEVASCVSDLLHEGILAFDDAGKLSYLGGEVFESEDPNQDLRVFHKAMLEKAVESIDKQTNDEKFIGSETLCLDAEKLTAARELADEFFNKLIELHRSSRQDVVYHVGVQVFRLTGNGATNV
jgi:uncharacterized protein (TIGR02147 family)